MSPSDSLLAGFASVLDAAGCAVDIQREPAGLGGICISGDDRHQVKNRLPLNFDFIGEQRFKNIAEPVKT
ncbi:MAG: hypothetical protein IIC13_06635 [SAR324 cluster bacterium]|nr:hypothetical protein [SAR324 cluster bacterium]MCH8886249.1 hypothetical protein [SAR324 cluster bacterium]